MSAAGRLEPRRRRFLLAWAVALGLGATAGALAQTAWHGLPHPRPLEELSYYPSGQFLEPATFGHAATAADLAWLRAVQYYGQHRTTDNHYVRMEHVFDILTSLDPSFLAAYQFGAFALAQEGRDFPAAERLMRKGLAAHPTSGPLAFQTGFLYYVRPGGRDLAHAAEYFEQAARQPDGPPEAARFAAFAHQNAGNLGAAFELWAEVARTTDNGYLRDMAEREKARIRRAIERGRRELAMRRLTTPIVIVGQPQ